MFINDYELQVKMLKTALFWPLLRAVAYRL